ncbi:MAG: hypothetical protein OXI91_00485 [Chloroflexota bacterium]|nr:hypothetical protein [Chloroflexota bacterium]
MDELRTHLVRESISDAIGILDSAPLQPSMFPQMYFLQVGNRIPVAHLAIERGLKALIRESAERTSPLELLAWLEDGRKGRTHSLASLYSKLREVDEERAKFLAHAFKDAVDFFGYDVERDGFAHFRSIDNYLSIVANKDVFKALRYWVIEGTEEQEKTMAWISPRVHREILCALRCLFFPDFRETVSERVVSSLINARFEGKILYRNGSFNGERDSRGRSIERLTQENACVLHVLETANKMGADVRALVATLVQAYIDGNVDTTKSDDHAVRYFFSTLSYLLSGSQPQDPKAVAEENWLKPDGTSREIRTSAGTALGWVSKLADGAWAIAPMEEGTPGEMAIAWRLKDAKNFLINRLTSKVAVTANGGKVRELRVFTRSHRWPFPTPASNEGSRYVGTPLHPHPDRVIYKLQFWDVNHGLEL